MTLSGVDVSKVGDMVVRDGRGRYAAISRDFRQILVFDAKGRLQDSPRPSFGRIVSLFVDQVGTVRTYDVNEGALLTFNTNYEVSAKLDLPYRPTLPLRDGRFLVAGQIETPGLIVHPLHVMSKGGSIEKSFGADGGAFHAQETFKNLRAVFANPDGTIWSIAPGGRLLERWDTQAGRRLAHVTVKSAWFRESKTPAPKGQVSNPIILTIWAEDDLVWILYRRQDPRWIPRKFSESEELGFTGDGAAERFDWILEAVRTDTGAVVAMKTFDRILLRRDGSSAVACEVTPADRGGGVQLWKPVVVSK